MSGDKSPYYFAAILIATVVIAFISVPFALLLFTASSGILLIRLYIQLYAKIKEEPGSLLLNLVYVSGIISLATLYIGYWFRAMHWPFGTIFFVLAHITVVISAFLAIITYFTNRSKKHNPVPYLLLLIPFVFALCATLFRYGVFNNEGKIAIVDKLLIENSIVEHQIDEQKKINSLLFNVKSYQAYDSTTNVHIETEKMEKYIEDIKARLIMLTGGRSSDAEYKGKMETTGVEIYLIGPEGSRSGEAYKLEEKLNLYYAIAGKSTDIKSISKSIQTFSNYFPHNTTLAEALLTLSHLELSVLQAEQEYYAKHLK